MMGGTASLKPMMGVLLAFAAIYFVVMIVNTVREKIKKRKREKEREKEEKGSAANEL